MRFVHVFIFISIILLAACSGEEIEKNMSEELMDFEFTTQHNEAFSQEELMGEWSLAYFMYTNCTQVCPRTTANMVVLQEALEDLGKKVQTVSFSVDPDYDTPEVLMEYAGDYDINLDNWTLLTGYEFAEVQDLSAASFKANLAQGSPGESEYSHSTSFFLINPDGQVIKKYDGMRIEGMDPIIEDLKQVL